MAYEAELDFYKTLDKLEKKRAEAFKTKDKDPAKWQAAKSEYRQFATAIKVLAGRTGGPGASGGAHIDVQPGPAEVSVTAQSSGG